MTVTRMNLWRLGNDWNPTMLWYAQAVRDLQKRPITDATSWTYLAAMHGFDRELWQGYGYIEATTPLPPAAAAAAPARLQHHRKTDAVCEGEHLGVVVGQRRRRRHHRHACGLG